jgi:hypothetical protein
MMKKGVTPVVIKKTELLAPKLALVVARASPIIRL